MSDDEVNVIPPNLHQLGDPRRNSSGWALMPAPPGVCSQCAVDHPPEQPHNNDALHYQYSFYAEHGRWPTWEDAMAHCEATVQEFWREKLRELGVKI